MSHDDNNDNTSKSDSEVKITFRTDGLAEAADAIAGELIATFDELDVPEGNDNNAFNALFDAHQSSPRRPRDEDSKKQQQQQQQQQHHQRSRSPPRASYGLTSRHGVKRDFTVPRARDGTNHTSPPSKRYMKSTEKQRVSDTPAIAARLRFLAHDACCAGPEPVNFARHMLDHLPMGADTQCATEAVQKIIDAVHYFYQARQHHDQRPGSTLDERDD